VDGAKRSGEEYQPQCLSAPPTLSDIKPLRQPARRKVSKLDIFGTYHVIHPSAWKMNSPKAVFGMLHSITLGNRHTAGQDVVSREN